MKFQHYFNLKSANPHTRIYEAEGVFMRLDFIQNMLRVALIRNEDLLPTFSINPTQIKPNELRDKLSLEGFDLCEPEVTEGEDTISFHHAGTDVSIERKNFRITICNKQGILYQDRSGLAYNFAGELGDGSVHYTAKEEEQYIYGLGDKAGHVNKNNQRYKLDTDDSMGYKAAYSDPLYKYLPFYICENKAGSYGIFYDTYSEGEVDFGKEHDNYYEHFNSIRYEEENMVFYLIFGDVKEIIHRFIHLTGGIGEVPEWALRYCGSTMEYTDADNAEERLHSFLDNCDKYGIQPGGFYMSSGYTQIKEKRYVFHWNTHKIPSPEGLAEYFNKKGVRLIPNIKPAFLDDHPLYQTIADNHWFLHYADGTPARFPFWGGNASYLDFTNPEAYDFWKRCVKKQLVDKGYTDLWNDNNEYDIHDKDVYAHGFQKEIPARLIKPLFSYLMSKASYEAAVKVNQKPFNVSRCGIAGTQSVASTWTGDNYTSFPELRYNHYQAMSMALSGYCFFGPDIGGFAGPQPSRELFLRWLQYGVFLPRFVLHSWKPDEESTMPWLYPDLMEPVKKIFDLRETLLSYLGKELNRCVKNGEPLITPVFLKDPHYNRESDFFYLGERILACPVFDEGVTEITVQLPESPCGFRLRGEGSVLAGGSSVTVSCHATDLPIFFVECGNQ